MYEHAARLEPVQRCVVDRFAVEVAARARGERRFLIGERRVDELFDQGSVRALPAFDRAVERPARRRRVPNDATQRERPTVRVDDKARDVALVAAHDARAVDEASRFIGRKRQPRTAAQRGESQRDQARGIKNFSRTRRVQERHVFRAVEHQPLQQLAAVVRRAVGFVDEDLVPSKRCERRQQRVGAGHRFDLERFAKGVTNHGCISARAQRDVGRREPRPRRVLDQRRRLAAAGRSRQQAKREVGVLGEPNGKPLPVDDVGCEFRMSSLRRNAEPRLSLSENGHSPRSIPQLALKYDLWPRTFG